MGSSTSGKDETGDKAFTFGHARKSRSGPRAQLPRPSGLWPVLVATDHSHRRALELQRAAVRGGPSVRSSVHPTPTVQCEQLRLPVMLRWLVGFGTILSVLAMLILASASRWQVMLTLTAQPARTQHGLTARCAPCAAGACLTLPFNHHIVRATWLGSATTCIKAAVCLVHHVHHRVCGMLQRAPRPASGGA